MIRGLPRFLVVAVLLFIESIHSSTLAQDKPLKKINWGVTSLSGGNWIPWIAKEAKIYEKHGLDVQLILLRGSGQLRRRFSAGAFCFAGGAADGDAGGS